VGDNKYVGDDGKVDEASIYKDAWRIADPGAANPIAVARTLFYASSALLRDIGTEGVEKHPALRVMAGQLASLYDVNSIGADVFDYDRTEAIAKYLEIGQNLQTAKLLAEEEVTNEELKAARRAGWMRHS
jgi:hypothetical protein